jgi:putative endonuclease
VAQEALKRHAGSGGEDVASAWLEAQGYRVVERNWRCRSGEVDLIVRRGSLTVFVEVKERRSGSHGRGLEAVTWTKRRRVVRAARLYAAARGLTDTDLRFDVVSVDGREVRHEPGAFDVDGS